MGTVSPEARRAYHAIVQPAIEQRDRAYVAARQFPTEQRIAAIRQADEAFDNERRRAWAIYQAGVTDD